MKIIAITLAMLLGHIHAQEVFFEKSHAEFPKENLTTKEFPDVTSTFEIAKGGERDFLLVKLHNNGKKKVVIEPSDVLSEDSQIFKIKGVKEIYRSLPSDVVIQRPTTEAITLKPGSSCYFVLTYEGSNFDNYMKNGAEVSISLKKFRSEIVTFKVRKNDG